MQKIKLKAGTGVPMSATNLTSELIEHNNYLDRTLPSQIVKQRVFDSIGKARDKINSGNLNDSYFMDKVLSSLSSTITNKYPYLKEIINGTNTGMGCVLDPNKFTLFFRLIDLSGPRHILKHRRRIKVLYRYLYNLQKKLYREKIPVIISLDISDLDKKAHSRVLIDSTKNIPDSIELRNSNLIDITEVHISFSSGVTIGEGNKITNSILDEIPTSYRFQKLDDPTYSEPSRQIPYTSFFHLYSSSSISINEFSGAIKNVETMHGTTKEKMESFQELVQSPPKALFFLDELSQVIKSILRMVSHEDIETFFIPRKNGSITE